MDATARGKKTAGRVKPHGRDGESAATQVFGFLVAGFVFIGAIGAILVTSDTSGADSEPVEAAGQGASAQSLADLFVANPGLGWDGGADGVDRLGLMADDGAGLEPEKLDALRGALEAATAGNGKLDYEEARASLGLAQGDFHIRIYPTSIETTIEQVDLSQIETAYIGDWSPLTPVIVTTSVQATALGSAQAKLDLQMALFTANERTALTDLGLSFEDLIYLEPRSPRIISPGVGQPDLLTKLGLPFVEGDVYPDSKAYLDVVLADRLQLYDLVIVGSGVDHSAFNDADLRLAIKDFVMDGGTLIVLGNDGPNADWLGPLFSVGVTTANGAAFAPDVTHPVLREPNALSWTAYDTYDKVWDIGSSESGADFDDFTHVVVQSDADVLAISNQGVFGDGRVFLTSYRPSYIAQDLGQQEAEDFFENFILYADRSDLYLDYGATLPADTSVSAAVRESHIWDEVLGEVPVRVEVHYWQ